MQDHHDKTLEALTHAKKAHLHAMQAQASLKAAQEAQNKTETARRHAQEVRPYSYKCDTLDAQDMSEAIDALIRGLPDGHLHLLCTEWGHASMGWPAQGPPKDVDVNPLNPCNIISIWFVRSVRAAEASTLCIVGLSNEKTSCWAGACHGESS